MLATTIPTEPTHNQPTHLLASRDTLPSEVIRVSLTHGGKEEDAPGRERPGEPDPQDAQVGEAKLRKIYMVFAVGGVILVFNLCFLCVQIKTRLHPPVGYLYTAGYTKIAEEQAGSECSSSSNNVNLHHQ